MKDIVDEIDSRIKSPLFGYFIFSLVATNWSELFYLFLHKAEVPKRIGYFEENTSVLTLFFYPFLVAAAYAIIYPWLQYLSVLFGVKPTSLKNNLQARSEHSLLIEKQKLEEARSELLKNAETELIERAKRDSSLDEIENEDVRETLKSEIDQLRKERDRIRSSIESPRKAQHSELLSEQEDLLRLITKNGGDMFQKEIVERAKYDKVKTEYYLEDLEEKGYLTRQFHHGVDQYYYELTTKSKKLMVEAGVVQ